MRCIQTAGSALRLTDPFWGHIQDHFHERNAHHGLHSLRATVATKLLSADVSPDIIFSFLGHSDRESLGHYIRLDIENLRECALSFEDGDLL